MAEPLRPPTDEQRAVYKAAYRAYCLAGHAVVASRAAWLPERPALPGDAQAGSQYIANMAIQQTLIAEVSSELEAEEATRG